MIFHDEGTVVKIDFHHVADIFTRASRVGIVVVLGVEVSKGPTIVGSHVDWLLQVMVLCPGLFGTRPFLGSGPVILLKVLVIFLLSTVAFIQKEVVRF